MLAQVSTLDLFKSILSDEKSLPKEQPYKDLISLINYVLRKFFKAIDEEPFLIIEVRNLRSGHPSHLAGAEVV
jgi:replication fork protection complex subunit Tof1/Swi1